MTPEEVLNNHKDIFREYFDPEKTVNNSCMKFGLEVPDHWLPIINDLCCAMKEMSWCGSAGDYPEVIAEQVKEKYGTIRFYYRLQFKKEPENSYAFTTYIDGMIAYADYLLMKMDSDMLETAKITALPLKECLKINEKSES